MKKVKMTLNKNELEMIIGIMSESISDNNTIDYLKGLGFSDTDIEKLKDREESRKFSVDYSNSSENEMKDALMRKLVENFLA